MQSIGITAKVTSRAALDFAQNVANDLGKRGFSVCYDDLTASAIGAGARCYAKTDIGAHADLLITFGGDGTLLSVARHAPAHVPILGVNMGTLGFLTEIRVEEFPNVLDRVLEGNYVGESRVAFEVTVQGPSSDGSPFRVLN